MRSPAVALTVPFLPHGWLIYPEIPGALVVAWASLWIWKGNDTTGIGRLAVRGALLAALPWLHTKFIIFLAVFGGAMLFQLRRRPRAAAAFAAPVAVSVASWLMFFYVIYGTFNPEAPYGDYPRMFVLMRNIPRGLLGLLFDQKFGLLIYAPVYLAAVGGTWLMLREREWRWLGAVLLAAIAIHVGSTTRLYMWWGGNSAPARFLVPILPCLAAPIAVAASRWRSPAARAFLWTTADREPGDCDWRPAGSRTAVALQRPAREGEDRRVVAGRRHHSPRCFPPSRRKTGAALSIGLLPWLVAAGITLAAVLQIQRRRGPWLSPLAAGTYGALIFLATASVLAMRVPSGERQEEARRGAVEVVVAIRPAAPARARLRDARTRVDQDAVFELSRIRVDSRQWCARARLNV